MNADPPTDSTRSPRRPAVSVVIPCFKQAHFLPEAVESVVQQTFKDWEVIVVNDGSPDNTRAVFHQMRKRWPAARLFYVEKPNGGLADARNTGITVARGRYILPLDADDRIEAAFLEKTVRVLDENPAVAIAYTDARFFGAEERLHRVGELTLPKLLEVNQINYCSLYRREVWEQSGGYNPNMIWGYEDWDFWLGCVERGLRAQHVPEPLFCYRVKAGSMITNALKHDRELRAQIVMNHPNLFSPRARSDAEQTLAEAAARAASASAATVYPPEAEPHLQRAQAAFDRGDLAGASAALREADTVAPDNVTILQALGSMLYQAGQLTEAGEVFDRALTVKPDNVPLLLQRAVVALRLGDVEAFEKALGRALELDPRNHDARRLLARVNTEAGRYLDAAKGWAALANDLPEDAELWVALGTCLAKLGDVENARTAFQRTLTLAPDHETAKENLIALLSPPVASKSGEALVTDQKVVAPSRNDAVAAAPHPNPLPTGVGRGRSSSEHPEANHSVQHVAPMAGFPLPSRARGEGQGEGSRPVVPTESFRPNPLPSSAGALAGQPDGLNVGGASAPRPASEAAPANDADPFLSVVITTYNRPDLLERCLAGFAGQSLAASQFEIIVVDDGSETPAETIVRKFSGKLRLTYHYQANSGLAAARNTGIALARGAIIVPYDDDNVPHSDCLREHLSFHRSHPAIEDAMLANLEWQPGLEVTPLMHYVTEVDPRLWCLKGLREGEPLRFGYLWGGCSSYKKELIRRAGGFDPRFRFGYEDTEAEVRMREHGLRVWWHPAAHNLVANPVTYEGFCRRCYQQGRSLRVFQRMYPDDPQVRAYTNNGDAREIVARTEPVLRSHLGLIASLLKHGGGLPAKATDEKQESLELLHQLFFVSFEYWKNKGILDADEPQSAGGAAQHRILIIAPELPAHDRASGAFRLFQIVKLLRAAGHPVTFLARAAAGELDPVPYVQDLAALGVEVIPCDPDKIEARWGVKVQAPRVDLKRLFADRRFDVVYIYFYEVAGQYVDEIRAISPATKIIVDSVDVHFLREERRAELENNAQMSAQAGLTRERELAVYGRADLTLTVTDTDAAALRRFLPEGRIAVLPNVHPIPPAPAPFNQRRDLLFVGGFQHHPNVDAMLYFVREVWPRVAKRLKDAKLFIVGDRPPQEIQQLAGERIVVTGFVPSVEPYLNQCRVSVAPLRYGAGMKGKIGEAAAAGLPVVSSSIGVEGMGLRDGQQVLVANKPKTFADAIVRLYQNAALWQKLSQSAREFILSRYSPDAVGRTLNAMLDKLSPLSPAPAAPAAAIEPEFSIIIPTLNNLALTKKCLQAIRETAAPCRCEVLIVDNGSTDGSTAFFAEEQQLGRLRVVTNLPGRNFSAANNQGAALARGQYLVFLNNDTKPLPGWIEALRETFDADAAIGVQGGKLLYPNNTIQHAGIVYGQVQPERQQHYHIYLCHKLDDPCVNRAREFQMVTGAMLAVRRELFERIGGFDENYEFGHEDLDLCLAARAAGSKVWFNPKAVAYHFESMTKKQVGLEKFELKPDQPDSMDYKNRQRFLKKWGRQLRCDDNDYYRQDGERSPFAARAAGAVQTAPKSGETPSSLLRVKTGSKRRLDGVSPHHLHVLFTMYGWADEGGGTILPRQIAKALFRRGHHVSVIYAAARPMPGKPAYHVEESVEDGVRLYAVYNRPAMFCDAGHPERETDDPEMRRVFHRLANKIKPDIVHYHSLLNFSLGVVDELHRAGVPGVYTSHNYWPICPRMYLFKERLELCPGASADGLRCAACVGQTGRAGDFARRLQRGREAFRDQVGRHLAVSHRVRELFIRSGHAPERIHVLLQQPQTVDALWSKVGSKRRIVERLDRPLRVGFIGSLYPQKGVHVLIQALQAFRPGEVEAHCFGNVPAEYGEALRKLDVRNLARFHGAYEPGQLPHLLADVDVMVVPSVWEDCAPLVVAEALAARCPVIGSRIGGIPDFIEDGVTGFLFRAGDAADLASVLRRFVADAALLGRMQTSIRQPKGFDGYLDELEDHYRQVIAEKPVAPSASAASAPARVIWEGSQFVHHSLALVNRELCLKLIEAGHDISILPYEPDQFGPEADSRFESLARRVRKPLSPGADVHVRHQWPFNPARPARGKWVVIQPWEFGCAPKAWMPALRDHVDELWVPSPFVRDCYVQSGVPAGKVVVVPNGIAPEKFRPGLPPLGLPTRKRFKFLFVGGTIHRKGADLALEAYLKSFRASDDVCLVIKDFGGKSVYAGQTIEVRIQQAQATPDAPEIVYLNSELPPEDLPRLYAACDCLVHPYRGEGFGLPVLEAMACGLPVIVTAGGATDAFVTDDVGCRIPAQRRSIGRKVGDLELAGEGWLLEPDGAALAERMQWVVAHRDEAKQLGLKASEYVRRDWTWERAAAIAGERLTKLAAVPQPRAAAPSARPLPAAAKLGDLAEARELLRQKQYLPAWNAALEAIRVRPFHPEAFLVLAEIARAAGDVNQARRCAQHARDLAPAWKPAKKFLKSLSGVSRAATITWPALPEPSATPRLSICIIAKNEERFLPRCLASVRDVAHQIVVVDTGSTDRTVEIAREHGAEVHTFPWNDDFSAARNAAHEHATGDWVLILDADEELPAESHAALRDHLRAASVMAYRIPIVNAGEEGEGCNYVPRLFRNAPGLFFVGRVHEQIFYSVEHRRRELCLENRLGKARIIHHGYAKDIVKDRNKIERNLRLLEQAIEETPNEPSLLMNYGLDLVNAGHLEAGLEKYREALRLMSTQPLDDITPEVRERLLTLYCTHLLRGRHFEEIEQALRLPVAVKGPGLTASMHFVLGLSYVERLMFTQAAEQMRRCIALRDRPTLTPACKELKQGGAQHCLAVCCVNLKQRDAAEEAFLAALAEAPTSLAIRYDFARFLWNNGQSVEALQQLHHLVGDHGHEAQVWQLGAQIALSQADTWEFAADWTGEAIKHLPLDPTLLLHRAEALLANGRAGEAVPLLRQSANGRTPAHRAVMILCELLSDERSQPLPKSLESAVSQEFLKRYRWLVNGRASSVVFHLNQALPALRIILPAAAGVLEAALSEADQMPAGDTASH